ncbi:MAG: hypothetical protein EOO43_07315 [Flavobacterium sp.]|nr:MAG: hypothetical protein EOO43_07315 [Flavobacterium sp.]
MDLNQSKVNELLILLQDTNEKVEQLHRLMFKSNNPITNQESEIARKRALRLAIPVKRRR